MTWGFESDLFSSCRVVGLKGMQPRAADTTATVMPLVLLVQTHLLYTDPLN